MVKPITFGNIYIWNANYNGHQKRASLHMELTGDEIKLKPNPELPNTFELIAEKNDQFMATHYIGTSTLIWPLLPREVELLVIALSGQKVWLGPSTENLKNYPKAQKRLKELLYQRIDQEDTDLFFKHRQNTSPGS